MSDHRSALPTAMLLVVTMGVVVTTTGALLSAAGREPTGLQVILSPHPDDEMLAWPAIEDDPSTYTVVVALTRGDATSRCADVARFTEQQAGEEPPDPLPVSGDTASCGRARVQAWSNFLRRASRRANEVRLGASTSSVQRDDRWGGAADFAVGTNAAHVMLSLPDGGLDETSVVDAVQAVLERRGEFLPDMPVRRILAAGYWNDSDQLGARTTDSGDCATTTDCPGTPAAFEYEHPDHRSLSLAMPELAELTGAATWVNVPPSSTAELRSALHTDVGEVRTMSLSSADYDALMGLGADGEQGPERLGILQQVYGWLAFPGDWWTPGETVADTDVLFARRQTYLVIPGGG